MINEVQEILINESEIQEKVKYLAEQINKDMPVRILYL